MTWKRAGDVLAEPKGPDPQAVQWKVAHEDAEQSAESKRAFAAKVKQPVHNKAGNLVYHCAACHDMGWLRADVPISHKLFGKLRMCECNPQFARYGDQWFDRFD